MVRLSIDARSRIITLHLKAFLVLEICKRLQEENICISCQSIQNLIAKFRYDQAIGDLPRRQRQRKITAPMRSLIKETIRNKHVGVTEILHITCLLASNVKFPRVHLACILLVTRIKYVVQFLVTHEFRHKSLERMYQDTCANVKFKMSCTVSHKAPANRNALKQQCYNLDS